MTIPKIYKLSISILIPLVAGGIGSIFTAAKIPSWYATLDKPMFTPPSWVFGPVWTTLFVLMGIALYYVWDAKRSPTRTLALVMFDFQLFLNVLWSICFFGLQNPGLAVGEIIDLWFSIAATMVLFYQIRPRAMYLLIPYLGWVTFASYLTYTIWRLN